MEELYTPIKADLGKVARTLGDAFYTYPIHKWLIDDDEFRKKQHPKISMVFAKYGYKFGNMVATSENCEGVMLYAPSDDSDVTNMQLVRCGVLKILLTKWGSKWLDDFDKVSKANDLIREKNAPDRHMYIWIVGVHPDHQRKKFASKMLNPFLKKMDEKGMPCYLETYKTKNVSIYKRFGFELLEEYPVPETPLTLYSMLRNVPEK